MSRYHSYLNNAVAVLQDYTGTEPFAVFLKKYFTANKKFGSSDRRHIAGLCFAYFRTGKAFTDLSIQQKIGAGLFLSTNDPHPVLELLNPEWNRMTGLPVAEKATLTGEEQLHGAIFPFSAALSEGIDRDAFALSHLQQPAVFLRIRPGHIKTVVKKLNDAGIRYKTISINCLQLEAGVKLDNLLQINLEAVIQDWSSQQLGDLMQEVPVPYRESVWDLCAASGGKSILALDTFGPVELTVTDIRESILVNLRKRFREAGIRHYRAALADLSRPGSFQPEHPVGCILADVPCSGSGTWGRTPEQLLYFDENRIAAYASLQHSIVTNALAKLQPGGYLLYSTCSVFREENEDMVDLLQQQFSLEKIKQEVFPGYAHRADSMFGALLRKTRE